LFELLDLFGKERAEQVSELLGLPNSISSADTFERVFSVNCACYELKIGGAKSPIFDSANFQFKPIRNMSYISTQYKLIDK
jgi:hypothetical protein